MYIVRKGVGMTGSTVTDGDEGYSFEQNISILPFSSHISPCNLD